MMPLSNPATTTTDDDDTRGLLRGTPVVLQPIPLERYTLLISELLAFRDTEAKKDDLATDLDCLMRVVRFLEADQEVEAMGVTIPLRRLANTLRDILQGAKPERIFARAKDTSGPATGQSFEAARGCIAFAVNLLIEAGSGRKEAGHYVANELRKYAITQPNGQPITGKVALRWRAEINSGSMMIAEKTFKAWQTEISACLSPEDRRDFARCRRLIQGMMMRLRHSAF